MTKGRLSSCNGRAPLVFVMSCHLSVAIIVQGTFYLQEGPSLLPVTSARWLCLPAPYSIISASIVTVWDLGVASTRNIFCTFISTAAGMGLILGTSTVPSPPPTVRGSSSSEMELSSLHWDLGVASTRHFLIINYLHCSRDGIGFWYVNSFGIINLKFLPVGIIMLRLHLCSICCQLL